MYQLKEEAYKASKSLEYAYRAGLSSNIHEGSVSLFGLQ